MYKQVIVVRKDLKLSPGKLAAQCCHASLGAYRNADKKLISKWEDTGEKKVVVQVENEKALLETWDKAKKLGIATALIKDAGHTEIAPGTITCLGLGPEEEKLIDKITGFLPLK